MDKIILIICHEGFWQVRFEKGKFFYLTEYSEVKWFNMPRYMHLTVKARKRLSIVYGSGFVLWKVKLTI